MRHDKLAERIMQLDDPELGASERAELEAHLAECASCGRALASWRGARRAFFRPPQPPTRQETELFARAVAARLGEPAVAWWRLLVAPALGLALAAAAVALALPRAPSDPAEALIESESGLSSFVSSPAPSGAGDALALAEGR